MSAEVDGTILLPEVEVGSKLIRDKPSFLSLPPLGWVVGRDRHPKSKPWSTKAFLDETLCTQGYVYGKKEPLTVT